MMIVKAQSALEYLMVIALTLAILVPTIYLFFRASSGSNVQIVDVQISQIGKEIIDTAETVYFSGKDSRIILELNMPKNVYDIYILANRELVFKVTSDIGETESVFFSSQGIPLYSNDCTGDKCELNEIATFGLNKVKIESVNAGDKILISKFEE